MTSLIHPQDKPILEKILFFANRQQRKIFLVGGYLRDVLLDRRHPLNVDMDFCLKDSAIFFAAKVAEKLKAGFVVLDRQHGCARVVYRQGLKNYTLDFSDFRGKNLEEDLSKRDFTINTLALDIKTKKLFDPYGAGKDIKRRVVRLVSEYAIDDDPLRILRAFTFAAVLGFRMEEKTRRLISSKAGLLGSISAERIREELFKILDSDRSFSCFVQLDKAKILEMIFPQIKPMRKKKQGPYHHLDIFGHSMLTLKHLELIIKRSRNPDIKNYLAHIFSTQHSRKALVKLAGFLHDVGKPPTLRYKKGKIVFHGHERAGMYMLEEIGRRLRLSNEEIAFLRTAVFTHLRPGYLAEMPLVTARAKLRFFSATGESAVGVLLISLADQRATRGRLISHSWRRRHEYVCRRLIGEFFKRQKEKPLPRLVDGHMIMKSFGIGPSVLVGRILRQIKEAQILGKVSTTQQALALAAKIIKKEKNDA